ncbi:hypothetical protein [Arthrobacter sp. MMS24-S77]
MPEPAIRRDDFWADAVNSLLLRPVYRKPFPVETDSESTAATATSRPAFVASDDDWEANVAAFLSRDPIMTQEFLEKFPEVRAAFTQAEEPGWSVTVRDDNSQGPEVPLDYSQGPEIPFDKLKKMLPSKPYSALVWLPVGTLDDVVGPKGKIGQIAANNNVEIVIIDGMAFIFGTDARSIDAARSAIKDIVSSQSPQVGSGRSTVRPQMD